MRSMKALGITISIFAGALSAWVICSLLTHMIGEDAAAALVVSAVVFALTWCVVYAYIREA